MDHELRRLRQRPRLQQRHFFEPGKFKSSLDLWLKGTRFPFLGGRTGHSSNQLEQTSHVPISNCFRLTRPLEELCASHNVCRHLVCDVVEGHKPLQGGTVESCNKLVFAELTHAELPTCSGRNLNPCSEDIWAYQCQSTSSPSSRHIHLPMLLRPEISLSIPN